jgi:hypothetical protein
VGKKFRVVNSEGCERGKRWCCRKCLVDGKAMLGVDGSDDGLTLELEMIISGLRDEIRASRWCISRVEMSSMPVHTKVKVSKKHGPVCLAMIENLREHEMFKILVIADDSDGKWRSQKPGMHVTERFNDGEEFLVMDILVDFMGGKFVRIEGNRMEVVVGVQLLKNARDGEV